MNDFNLLEDEIVSIEECGENDTIDITVDGTHMFFANDIYTHNSGFNAEFVEAYQTGGSIKRLQKAHFFMSIAKTPAQQEANFANIRIIKARFAKDGQSFEDCTFNNDTMEIIIEDKRYPLKSTLKKYGIDDADKISDTANSFVEKSTEMPIHVAVNRHTEGSLFERINNNNINDNINNFENNANVKNDLIEIESVSIINDVVNDVVNEGVKDDDLLDIENKPIEKIIVNEGVKDLLKPIEKVYYVMPKKESFEWTGETFTVGTNETVVTFEDIPPKIVIKENIIVKEQVLMPKLITKGIITDEELIDIEKMFIDPDASPAEDEEIYKILNKAEKHQNVIKKE